MWHVTPDMWHVTRDMWHVTRDTWHVTCDTWPWQVTGGSRWTFSQKFSSLALTVWEWRWRDTVVSRILRIKHPRLLLMARQEGCDEHSWAQSLFHIQAAVYFHDYQGSWVFFCMLWGRSKSVHSFVSLHALGHHRCYMFSVHEYGS